MLKSTHKKLPLPWPLAFWALLSLALLVMASAFHINELLPNPRHELYGFMAEVAKSIESHDRQWAFTSYLVLDVFWWALSLYLISRLSLEFRKRHMTSYQSPPRWVYIAFSVIAILSLGLRVGEAFLYHSIDGLWLESFRRISLIVNMICVGFLAYACIRHVVVPYLKTFLTFVRDAILSIVFILLIYLLITQMDQGGTILVDLFYRPWNLFILFAVLAFLAIIISHFPVYGAIWWKKTDDKVRLLMAEKWRLLGFGTIYYDTSVPGRTDFDNPQVQSFRRGLGILMYIAVFLIFFQTAFRYFEVPLDAMGLSGLLLGLTLWMYYKDAQRYRKWKNDLQHPALQKKAVVSVVQYVKSFPGIFLGMLILSTLTSIAAHRYEWSSFSVGMFLFTLGWQLVTYIRFKVARSFFKYVFRSDGLQASNDDMFDQDLKKVFERFDPGGNQRGKPKWLYLIGRLSDNIRYLGLMRIAGILSLIALVAANFSFVVASFFSPLVIIVLYIILYYSLFVLFFKHILYYHAYAKKQPVESRASRWTIHFHAYIFPLLLLGLIALGTVTISQPNDLHRLREVPVKNSMAVTDYVNRHVHDPSRVPGPTFFLASYGGGLKANLWNLLLLHELDTQPGEILERTAVLSGVSGGAVGIGNYTSLLCNSTGETDLSKRIDSIGLSNVLSNELTYLLGRDWIQEFIPLNLEFGVDRAFKSMEHHAALTNMQGFNDVALSTYWEEVYKQRNGRYPALVFNTTAVGGKQGVIPSLEYPEGAFPGAVDITRWLREKNGHSLTFYGGVSTTNRFPLFSPTAKIRDLGNFLDGGYFDNSGMLSALATFKVMQRAWEAHSSGNPDIPAMDPVFVSIINSRDYYVKQRLQEWEYPVPTGIQTSEIFSIVSTITSVDKLPDYALSLAEKDPGPLKRIMMPHKISYIEAIGLLSKPPEKPFELMRRIEAHNLVIDDALDRYKPYLKDQWGVVEPPLARLLSTPAVMYQKAMIAFHPDIREVVSSLNQTTTPPRR